MTTAERVARWRAENPARTAEHAFVQKRRQKALRILGSRYRRELAQIMKELEMAECRSCHREIEWTIVAKSGKKMPIDPNPRPNGNVEILPNVDGETGMRMVEVVAKAAISAEHPRYVSHFTTCPKAAEHRKGR